MHEVIAQACHGITEEEVARVQFRRVLLRDLSREDLEYLLALQARRSYQNLGDDIYEANDLMTRACKQAKAEERICIAAQLQDAGAIDADLAEIIKHRGAIGGRYLPALAVGKDLDIDPILKADEPIDIPRQP